MNIQVSNFNASVGKQELADLFSAHGEVASAEVAMDVFTGKSRGFGFVEMPDEDAAQQAIKALHNSEFKSQVISVEEARPTQVHKGSYKVGNGAVQAYRFKKN